jgi:hypothetical protein
MYSASFSLPQSGTELIPSLSDKSDHFSRQLNPTSLDQAIPVLFGALRAAAFAAEGEDNAYVEFLFPPFSFPLALPFLSLFRTR